MKKESESLIVKSRNVKVTFGHKYKVFFTSLVEYFDIQHTYMLLNTLKKIIYLLKSDGPLLLYKEARFDLTRPLQVFFLQWGQKKFLFFYSHLGHICV